MKKRKASRNNRGATPDITRGDWRTDPRLFRAIEAHFRVRFILDAAADENNRLCHTFISKEMNTLKMSPYTLQELFNRAHKFEQEKVGRIDVPAIWCNPDYNDADELLEWIEIAGRFSSSFAIPWIFLLPSSRSEQPWFQRAIYWAPQLCLPEGRCAFLYPDGTRGPSPNHPSAVIAFGAPRAGVRDITSLSGDWRLKPPFPKLAPKKQAPIESDLGEAGNENPEAGE